MFCTVEHVNVPVDRLGRNKIWILRHVARPVDLAVVVDGVGDANTSWGFGVGAEFCGEYVS